MTKKKKRDPWAPFRRECMKIARKLAELPPVNLGDRILIRTTTDDRVVGTVVSFSAVGIVLAGDLGSTIFVPMTAVELVSYGTGFEKTLGEEEDTEPTPPNPDVPDPPDPEDTDEDEAAARKEAVLG